MQETIKGPVWKIFLLNYLLYGVLPISLKNKPPMIRLKFINVKAKRASWR